VVADDWKNFAIMLDFPENAIQVWHSLGNDEKLKNVTSPLSNDDSGDGQNQINILKKSTRHERCCQLGLPG
jgi:hypothetical protein